MLLVGGPLWLGLQVLWWAVGAGLGRVNLLSRYLLLGWWAQMRVPLRREKLGSYQAVWAGCWPPCCLALCQSLPDPPLLGLLAMGSPAWAGQRALVL